MTNSIEAFQPHGSGDFLSENQGNDSAQIDLSSLVTLEELDIKSLRTWNKNNRTYNGIAPLVGTIACYIARVGEHSYYVQHAEPFSDVDAVGHTINKTPAFITQDDAGINETMTAIAVEAGFNMTVVSQEAGWQKCPSLAATALNHIAISDKLRNEKQRYEAAETLNTIEDEEGVSRGCILAIEKARMRQVLGRTTGNLEGIVPVYHHNNSLLQDLSLYLSLPFKEARGITKIVRHEPAMIGTLKNTVIRKPWEVVHAFKSIQVLRKAQTQTAIQQLDPLQPGTITIAGRDSFKQTQELIDEFSVFPNMNVRHVVDGHHVSFMDPAELEAYRQRTNERAETMRNIKSAA